MATPRTQRLALPSWRDLEKLVLLTLLGEQEPIRRYALAERTVASRTWPRALRDQQPLATNPTHPSHLAER